MTSITSPTSPPALTRPPVLPSNELLIAIHSGDPEAALPLYSCYAAGIEAHLRRKRPDLDYTHCTLEILFEVIRVIRTERSFTPLNLTALVLRCTRAYIARLPRPSASRDLAADLALNSRAELVNHFFSRLPTLDREIIMRTYLLHQDDSTIAREMCILPQLPAAIRSELRRHLKNRVLNCPSRPQFPQLHLVAIH